MPHSIVPYTPLTLTENASRYLVSGGRGENTSRSSATLSVTPFTLRSCGMVHTSIVPFRDALQRYLRRDQSAERVATQMSFMPTEAMGYIKLARREVKSQEV
jgi:hypothetical protein